jgi:ABC-type multidrug transport system ATPase subunit
MYAALLSAEVNDSWYGPLRRLFDRVRPKKSEAQCEETVNFESDVQSHVNLVSSKTAEELVQDYPVLIRSLTKRYHSGPLAVDNVSLAIGSKQVFGLLGPNGAGKTTLLHMLAGLHHPTSGMFWINGQPFDRRSLTSTALCPQHDIYWEGLTCAQHLIFFALLRGKEELSRESVQAILDRVKLGQYANTPADQLSGGELRRLSIAMALSGDSPIVLLDEPTTGLDPKVRKLIWSLIADIRTDHLVILTTHSMEEAEMLSDQLTIMAHGSLRCIGTPMHLKQKFGGQTFITVLGSGAASVPSDLLMQSFVSQDRQTAKYRFTGSKPQLLALLRDFDRNKSAYGVDLFTIRQSSLDDVFMNIVKESDADA